MPLKPYIMDDQDLSESSAKTKCYRCGRKVELVSFFQYDLIMQVELCKTCLFRFFKENKLGVHVKDYQKTIDSLRKTVRHKKELKHNGMKLFDV